MKWSKERDDLIAQTKAFVQSVTGRRPQLAPERVSIGAALVRAVPIDNPVAQLVSNSAASAGPIENFVAAESIERGEQTSDLPPVTAQSEVRKEIQTHIAAFQAHQHRFHREREAYFNAVLTKARSAIKNGPDVPTS
jgi:hypothetical protein